VGAGFNWAQAESQWQCQATAQFGNQHYHNSILQWIGEMCTIHIQHGQAKVLAYMNGGWQGNYKSEETIKVIRWHDYQCFWLLLWWYSCK
jgi:hypothetical protein